MKCSNVSIVKKSLDNSVIGVGIWNGCCAVELPFFATSNSEFKLLTGNKWADLESRYGVNPCLIYIFCEMSTHGLESSTNLAWG